MMSMPPRAPSTIVRGASIEPANGARYCLGIVSRSVSV